jgi:hypothetical protein
MKPQTKAEREQVLCAIEWLQENWQDLSALAGYAFVSSEPHLSGHLVRIGFETQDSAMRTHTLLGKLAVAFRPTQEGQPK